MISIVVMGIAKTILIASVAEILIIGNNSLLLCVLL